MRSKKEQTRIFNAITSFGTREMTLTRFQQAVSELELKPYDIEGSTEYISFYCEWTTKGGFVFNSSCVEKDIQNAYIYDDLVKGEKRYCLHCAREIKLKEK